MAWWQVWLDHGGNVTGLSNRSADLAGKRLGLLRAVASRANTADAWARSPTSKRAASCPMEQTFRPCSGALPIMLTRFDPG